MTEQATAALPTDGLVGKDLRLSFHRTPVVHGVSIDVAPGEVLVLVGPNGSGKSTVLRALARLHAVSSGEVLLNGTQPISGLSPKEFARRVTLLTQHHGAASGMSVRDVVALGRHPHRRLTRPDVHGQSAIDDALLRAGVAALAHRPLNELSGGEVQRVWLATCLAQQAGVILLDEPTNHLDLRYQGEVLDLLRDLADDGQAVGAVLHDLNHAAAVADRIVLMADGRVVASGHPDDVITVQHISAAYGVPVTVQRDEATGALTTRILGRHCRNRLASA
ncbi:ABC transporter ATP-binding protein [Tessaracoccus sp. ZS01]|uniref:ABC transporter ATP-binding protein n=1 Tax=Tessaracoccus sp. ZS01 TaxID=1906324 RepID=UPI00096D0533|nr:ABC transporter ATP-binding protein [Tessaracoccus sp. ZS01]MCG6566083.1 ABC transporter ATP-binding protein [Tessaracoccus sp. ZS01]OMG58587.1 iron-dicitrate transporter ATP-binding subunit [Tessaracoccus sp. ZS01]